MSSGKPGDRLQIFYSCFHLMPHGHPRESAATVAAVLGVQAVAQVGLAFHFPAGGKR